MLRIVRTLFALSTPSSTPTEYYFDPKLATSGSTNFKSEKTNGRVSAEEFKQLRDKIIEGMGPDASKAKCMHYSSIIAVILYILYWVTKIVLLSARIIHLTQNQSLIIAICVTIPFLIFMCYWRSFTTKASGKVQGILEKENIHTYSSRGLRWKVGPMLTWIRLSMSEANYQPPQAYGYPPQQNYNAPAQDNTNQA